MYKGSSCVKAVSFSPAQAHLRLVHNPPLLQRAQVLLSLMIELRLEESVVVAQLVVLGPVLLCLLQTNTSKTQSSVKRERGGGGKQM